MQNYNSELLAQEEKNRQEVEKLLWRAYNPEISPNMEELSESIVKIFQGKDTDLLEATKKDLGEMIENERDRGTKSGEKFGDEHRQGMYEGSNAKLDDILLLLKDYNPNIK